ncbi:hypothetical protein ACLKA6_014742 [Drosophila palustris]
MGKGLRMERPSSMNHPPFCHAVIRSKGRVYGQRRISHASLGSLGEQAGKQQLSHLIRLLGRALKDIDKGIAIPLVMERCRQQTASGAGTV